MLCLGPVANSWYKKTCSTISSTISKENEPFWFASSCTETLSKIPFCMLLKLYHSYRYINIGMIHVFFHALTRSCLKTRQLCNVPQILPRDLTNVNAVNKMCVIVILAHFPLSTTGSLYTRYGKTCAKRPLKNRQSKELNDKV